MTTSAISVIAIDGPTASGKGTVAHQVANRLGYHYLDSGALYRLTALSALRRGTDLADEHALAKVAEHMCVHFDGAEVLLANDNVSAAIRAEEVGNLASKIAALPAVRQALFALQLGFRRAPGLVADGRDMGTVIFPDSTLKVFLTASAGQRAERRHKQLISKGISTTLDSLRADLEARDARDSSRSVAPLQPAQDARRLDNSTLSIEQSVEQVLNWWQQTQPFRSA